MQVPRFFGPLAQGEATCVEAANPTGPAYPFPPALATNIRLQRVQKEEFFRGTTRVDLGQKASDTHTNDWPMRPERCSMRWPLLLKPRLIGKRVPFSRAAGAVRITQTSPEETTP